MNRLDTQNKHRQKHLQPTGGFRSVSVQERTLRKQKVVNISDCRMAVKLPRLCLLLLLLFSLGSAQEIKCQKFNSSCDECIESGPECAWCTAPNAKVRCHTLEELQRAGCTEVYNPEQRAEFLRSEPRPARLETVFMQPQELSIYLRPGRRQTIQLEVFLPADRQNTQVTLEAVDKPEGMDFTLTSNITGDSGLIEVSVDAGQCPSRNQNMTGPWFAYVMATDSLLRVKLNIYLECHCSCSLHREEKSAACGGRGAHVCGHCECDQFYFGETCQTEEDPFFFRDQNACRPNPNATPCSGRGTCVYGECACDKLIHPRHIYSGRYCECTNFHCPRHNNKICGDHGQCSCNHCVCKRNWTGEACECSTDMTPCMATNGQVCNGRGVCDCGVCRCTTPRFMGPTCEHCPTCPGFCQNNRPCVECRAFGTGEMASRCDEECNDFSMTMVDTSDQLHEMENVNGMCKERSRNDDCFFYFTYTLTSTEKKVTVARAKNCPYS